MNIFNQFQIGLKKTSSLLSSNILSVFSLKKINQETIEDLESILISSDIGLDVTNHLINKLKSNKKINPSDTKEILMLIANELELLLKSKESPLIKKIDNKPTILLFIGVNGSGKTTTIGKILNKIPEDKKIIIAACDTFRAAAIEQLKEWVRNSNSDFYQGSPEQDPASVAYNACKKAKEENYDYVLIDTAGRLSNNTNLLNQLIKIKNVINNKLKINNIKTILVLDGTNGSNMINQVEIFGKSLNVNGLIITKLDGTAKGGALISIAKKYEIPIHYVGLGESKNDLVEFEAKKFSYSILDLDY